MTEDLISTVVGIVKSRVVEVIKIMYDTPRKKRIGAAPSEASKGARPVKVACNELLREYGSNAGSMIYCLSANGMLRKITRLGIDSLEASNVCGILVHGKKVMATRTRWRVWPKHLAGTVHVPR